jgi:aspartate kinase
MDYKFRKISGSMDIAKLSVSGIGLRSHTSVAIAMFKSLADSGINVLMINTSELRVNVVVDGKQGQKGLDCLQSTFAASLL